MGDRNQTDYAARWFREENDFLGDPFSSHVNPVFWRFHGWIDDRIEDWYRAHERAHPGEVQRREVNGVSWFAPGRWVQVGDPWLGPMTHGCGDFRCRGRGGEMEVEAMKLALRIAFSGEREVDELLRRTPRRPWYARHMKLPEGRFRLRDGLQVFAMKGAAPVRSSAAARRIASCARSYVCFGPVTPVADARDRLVDTTRYRAMCQGVRAKIPQE